jgi:hypothetical protein
LHSICHMLDDAGDGGEAHERRNSDGVYACVHARTQPYSILFSPPSLFLSESRMPGFRPTHFLNMPHMFSFFDWTTVCAPRHPKLALLLASLPCKQKDRELFYEFCEATKLCDKKKFWYDCSCALADTRVRVCVRVCVRANARKHAQRHVRACLQGCSRQAHG